MQQRAAARQQQERRRHEIKIESSPARIHSAQTKSHIANKVKKHMGRQYNKTEHKQRRKAYIKRKKAVIKAKVAAAKK